MEHRPTFPGRAPGHWSMDYPRLAARLLRRLRCFFSCVLLRPCVCGLRFRPRGGSVHSDGGRLDNTRGAGRVLVFLSRDAMLLLVTTEDCWGSARRLVSDASAPSETPFPTGLRHCLDMTAEDLDQREVVCPPGHVPCGNGSSRCLSRLLHCDGVVNCPGGEDERHCSDVYGGLGTLMDRTDIPRTCYCESYSTTRVFCENANLTHVPRAISDVTRFYFKKFHYCSYAPYVRICMPKTDGLSSTEHLLVWPVLRLSVWVVAFTTCTGNSVVFAWRFLAKKEDRVLSLFIKNLSMADLLMGIYLVTVGSLDVAFRDEYNKHAHQWMSSWFCTLCGLVAMVSCEVSVLILSLITIERYCCIKTNVRAVTVNAARYFLAVVWLAGLVLALFPVLRWPSERAFYSSNGLCFPLHIDDPFMLGWEYSAFVFLGINFFAMVLVMGLYLSMFCIIKEDRQRARPVTMKKQEDAVLALRFFFIVLTDCMCWIPIVIIKILALLEVQISENIYAWVVVFILPINSALNPVIYTLAAPTELRRRIEKFAQRLLKCHKRLECMLTSSRTPRSSVATQSLTGTDVPSVSTDCTSGGSAYHPVSRQSCAAIHELSESSEADDTVL
ncbi:adenosine A3 receptor, putative [Ixodes scapularis]|uniref:Adenosine A3 receptor, putative n=1 Tax=Ixodes scapularis TaxID=6945 RepID=B7PGJ8_IXOSC|nr:adenosine A3 receptor, putative [Ixodes scapularis]|eukprot:XP_002400885.1 adenosine A3 receptor, putative [Ixodes scapularis]